MLKCDIFLFGKSFTTHNSEQQVKHLEWEKEDCVPQDLFRLTKKLHGKPANLFHSQSEKTKPWINTSASERASVASGNVNNTTKR